MANTIRDEINKIRSYGLLDGLLKDMSSGGNIMWATDDYAYLGKRYGRETEITAFTLFRGGEPVVLSRAEKQKDVQYARTRQSAEVFTPSWVCKKMNDFADAVFLKDMGICGDECDEISVPDICGTIGIENCLKYIDRRVLEITCGEAPYLTGRYDVSTGEYIPISDRTGLLDRKLRVVNDISSSEDEWYGYALRALRSVYGYEFQGDSLVVARVNIFATVEEYYGAKFASAPCASFYRDIITAISRNIWQMDGLTDMIPYSPENEGSQMSVFDYWDGTNEKAQTGKTAVHCRVYDWNSCKKVQLKNLKKEGKRMFDFIIGNPPYQEESAGDKKADNSIYHYFMDAAYELAYKVELITPARFLFGNGNIPSLWVNRILNDKHFKVLDYEPDASKIFSNVSFKGGVAIHYYDRMSEFEPVKMFTKYAELNSIVKKVESFDNTSLTTIMYNQNCFNLSNLYRDFPEIRAMISGDGTEKRMTSNCISYPCFHKSCMSRDDIKILGLLGTERVYRYISRKYLYESNHNLDFYKVIVPANNGSGAIGEVLSTPLIGAPLIGYTQTFISIGNFKTESEAVACLKYVKSKFARVMLGVLKVTQNGKRDMWKYVPMQDFTPSSDIDWTKSVAEIDRQLYRKYGLNGDEIAFIEKNVKEME